MGSHIRVRGLRAVLVVGAFLLGVPVTGGWAAQAQARRDILYGVYFLGGRIGGTTVKQSPTKFQGRNATRIEATTNIKMVALGEVSQNINLVHIIDAKGTPLFLRMKMDSAGHTTSVAASFFPNRVECTIDSQGTKSKKVVPIPKGVTLVADPQELGEHGKKSKLKPGTKIRVHFFEPMTLQILPLELEVLREEILELNGKKYGATVVKSTNKLSGESTDWLADDGTLLQEENRLGMRLVQEEKAPAAVAGGAFQPPVDFALATSIKTTTKLDDARAVRFLRVRISGIPEEGFILSDTRQKAQREKDSPTLSAIYEVSASEPPTAAGTTGATPADARAFLTAAPYLEVDDARIRQQAAEIAGDEKDPAVIARKVRAWVHGHMKAQTNIGVIRSATDVLQSPQGVCRDYATLFAALARAAGVPTRVCAGIVYFKEAFYYHAWNECRVGSPEALWATFDSTLPTDFVDATHIKFAEGNPTDMFQSVRVVGQLKAEILEYR